MESSDFHYLGSTYVLQTLGTPRRRWHVWAKTDTHGRVSAITYGISLLFACGLIAHNRNQSPTVRQLFTFAESSLAAQLYTAPPPDFAVIDYEDRAP